MTFPDPSYNASNYEAQGGKQWVIGADGSLDIATGGKITAAGTQATTFASVVDNSGGTGATGGTLTAANATYSATTYNNNIAVLAAEINAILAAIKGVGIVP